MPITPTASSFTSNNGSAGMYYDYHTPLGLFGLIEDLKDRQPHNVNCPEIVTPPVNREWLSQPRVSTDDTVEVITVRFKLPVSVGEISWQMLRVSCHAEVWYQDRSSNWLQMVNQDGIPITVDLSSSSVVSWYTHHTFVYPIVVKAVQFRFKRTPDSISGNQPYSVGMKEALIRRNIYNRQQGTQALETLQDAMGNVVSQYVKDWDASQAVDNNALTYWRSSPQPDPSAVVNLYLDCRDVNGNPQIVDKVYIDPVYAGNAINLYYSSDTASATLKLSPVSLIPDTQENTTWVAGQGLWDNTPLLGGGVLDADYTFAVSWGPLVSQNVWIGIEWTPEFDPTDGPAADPVLYQVTPTNDSGTQWWPKIFYDVGASQITLEMTNGMASPLVYSVTLSPLFTEFTPLKIVVGWTYPPAGVAGTPTIYMDVDDQTGNDLGTLLTADANFPTNVTLDGESEFHDWYGFLSAFIIKLDTYATDSTFFQANPVIYTNPNPVLPDLNGNIPSTTLDNAILAADFTTMQYLVGGTHESWYTSKEWVPIWINYVAQQGYLNFPKSVSLSYLNLEFSQLTPESYPVYDQGIQVQYQVFPITVTASAIQKNPRFGGERGLLSLGSDIIMGQPQTVNWLNPSTVSAAVNSAYGLVSASANVSVGSGYTTSTLPNTAVSTSAQVIMTTRQELSNPYIYRRTPMSALTLTQTLYHNIFGQQTNQGNQSSTDASQQAISNATTPAPVVITQPAATGVQGQDWYIFPGQTLKMPASIINGLTGRNVICGRTQDSTMRIRFTTTAVHQYSTNTVTLDASMAYFAGVREVQPYVTTYVDHEDPISFDFTTYDPNVWVFHNVNKLASGPITAVSNPYQLMNGDFDLSLVDWTLNGDWTWDDTAGAYSGPPTPAGIPDFSFGSAHVTANGTNLDMMSLNIPVTPGDVIDVGGWFVFDSITLATTAAGEGIYIDVVGYAMDGMTVMDPFIPLGSNATVNMYTVKAATTGNILLSAPGATFDGIAPSSGDLLLVRAQTVLTENGVYQFHGAATPLTLVDGPLLVAKVTGGTLYAGTYWTLTPLGVADEGNSSIPEYGVLARHLYGTFTVPGGVYNISIRPNVNSLLTGGTVWYDKIYLQPHAGLDATIFSDFTTASTFAKVEVEVQDSGLVRSDGLWAQEDPLDTNISSLSLAFYVQTIPSIIQAGAWGDTFADWADLNIDWGEPRGVVAITIDPDMVFDGQRVIHFSRAAGAGEAGIISRQTTFFVANGLARINATWFKPNSDNDTITIKLRRVSDGVYIYQETIPKPVVGYWYRYQSAFFEIPDSLDQVYTVELTITGDQTSDLYLNDLWCDVAGGRYFLRMGDSSEFLHDITPLVYGDNCVVSATAPVNEFSVTAEILSDSFFLYSSNFRPIFLK